MAEVGTVYVSVMPTAKGFSKALSGQGAAAGAEAGNKFNLSFGKLIAGSAIGGIITNAFSKVSGAISSSLDSAIGRADILSNFPKVMQSLGYSAEEAAGSIGTIKDHLNGLPSKTQDLATFVKQIAATGGSLQGATDVGLAFNDMLLASGASTDDASYSMQAFSKMLAGGKPEADNWMTLMQAMPGQMNLVAESLLGAGNDGWALQKALKDGKVSMEDFKGAIVKAAQEGGEGFEAFSIAARNASGGIETSMGLIKTRIANTMANVLSHIGVDKISGAIDAFSSKISGAGDVIIAFYDGVVSKIDFKGFASAFDGVGQALGRAFGQGDAATTFGEQIGSALNMFIGVILAITPAIEMFANVLRFVMDNASWLVPVVITLIGAFKLFGIMQSVTPGLQALAGGLTRISPAAGASAVQMMQLGVAVIAFGVGIAIACAGVALLVMSAIQLAQAGPMAALGLMVLVGVIAIFALGAAALGPALTAGAVGMVAFGAAILMVGAGIAVACAGMVLLSGALPGIGASGTSAAAALLALGGAMLIAGPAAIVLGAGLVVAGAGAVVAGAGFVVLAAGAMAVGAGLLLCMAPAAMLGPMLTMAGSGSLMLGSSLLVVAASSLAAAPGLVALAASATGVAVGIGLAVPAFAGLAGAMAGCSGSVAAMGAAFLVVVASSSAAGASATACASQVRMVGAAMSSVSGQVQSACSRMTSQTSDLAFRIQASMSRIQATFNSMRLEIPSPSLGPMPHFSLSGKFDLQAGTVPTINVDWYAKGGMFNRPSIIGVGEAGTEVVAPLDKLTGYIASAVRDGSSESTDLSMVIDLLQRILFAIPSLSQRDLQREMRRATYA